MDRDTVITRKFFGTFEEKTRKNLKSIIKNMEYSETLYINVNNIKMVGHNHT